MYVCINIYSKLLIKTCSKPAIQFTVFYRNYKRSGFVCVRAKLYVFSLDIEMNCFGVQNCNM